MLIRPPLPLPGQMRTTGTTSTNTLTESCTRVADGGGHSVIGSSKDGPVDLVDLEDLEDLEVAGMEPASAWTGAKKRKIQSTPTTRGDLDNTERDDIERSSVEIIRGLEQEQDEIEGWDEKRLHKEIQALRKCRPSLWLSSDDDDDIEHFNEEDQKALNQRLALCRIRGHEKNYRDMNDESLLKLFPPDDLERNCYYKRYEYDFDWFFDPEYCKFARVEDYQRLVLCVTSEFGDLDICPYTRHTLKDDQQFVEFWEKLSRQTELIEKYITGRSCERRRVEKMLLYRALKIAAELSPVNKTPVVSIFREFILTVEADYTYAGFLTKMWELLAKKMNFVDALRCVFKEGKYRCFFRCGTEFEPNLGPIERIYKPHLDRIVKEAQDGAAAHQLVMDTIVENFWKARRYYDYVRKKMRIAEEIRLIPKQPPHRLYTADSIAKIACHVPLT